MFCFQYNYIVLLLFAHLCVIYMDTTYGRKLVVQKQLDTFILNWRSEAVLGDNLQQHSPESKTTAPITLDFPCMLYYVRMELCKQLFYTKCSGYRS